MSNEALTTAPLEARPHILIVDDEVLFAKAVAKKLHKSQWQTQVVHDLASARTAVAESLPDMILLDMRLPDGSGIDFLTELNANGDHSIGVVVLTAFGGLEDAVAAMKTGALDYLKKPIDLDELQLTLDNALARNVLSQKLEYSKEREANAVGDTQLLGSSEPIAQLREQMTRIQAFSGNANVHPPTVLILGETGTGKDLTARLLHLGSARANLPFVHIDCAGLPKDLIEAELFGHAKGAFTDAREERTGLVEAAENGSVFFDEVGELPLALQAKLLALLERRVVRKVGSNKEHYSQAWFMAATNRNLALMVEEGEFRADLYFRLKVLTLDLPALRERDADKVVLAQHFAHTSAKRYGLAAPQFSQDALLAIEHYPWPGNVRELQNLVERAVLLSGDESITATALGLQGTQPAQAQTNQLMHGMTLEEAERVLISNTLRETGGNVSETARQLGITRMALRYRLDKYAIAPKAP